MADQDTVTLSTSPTLVLAADDKRLSGADGVVYLKNLDASITVTFGDAAVADGEGLVLEAGEREAIKAILGRPLYAVAASGTPDITYYIR